MSFKGEVINRAERMVEALDEGTESDLLKAARLGCAAMRYLVDESPFREAPSHLESLLANEAVRTFLTDEDGFKDFLRVERKVLERAGVSRELLEQVIDNCDQARRRLMGEGEFEIFRHTLDSVKFRACEAEQSVRDEISRGASKPTQRLALRGIATSLVGGIVYVTNKTLDVTIYPIFSPASELVGGGIFGHGLGKFMPW